ncbi:unnamed protein product, partial [Urochloa humidicola]
PPHHSYPDAAAWGGGRRARRAGTAAEAARAGAAVAASSCGGPANHRRAPAAGAASLGWLHWRGRRARRASAGSIGESGRRGEPPQERMTPATRSIFVLLTHLGLLAFDSVCTCVVSKILLQWIDCEEVTTNKKPINWMLVYKGCQFQLLLFLPYFQRANKDGMFCQNQVSSRPKENQEKCTL